MDLATSIRRALPVLVQYGTADSVIVTAWLTRAGLTKRDAEDAQRFIPLAFGREILRGMGVHLSETYIRAYPDGTQEERPLSKEKFFSGSSWLASQIASEIGGDAFTAIVSLSPEFDAVNQALNAGASPDGLVASPPLVPWTDRPREEDEPRPWWKFWA